MAVKLTALDVSTSSGDVQTIDPEYDKREGTSGMSGQLYETNLAGLVLFRLQHDESVEQLYLASNMDKIGSFDDICFRVQVKGREHPVLVFIQAKHKDNKDTFLNYDLFKHFYSSYVKVRQKFCTNEGVIFKGKFEDIQCVFILYTNAKYCNDAKNVRLDGVNEKPVLKQESVASKLNEWIATGDGDMQGSYTDLTDKDLEYANEKILKEEINTLAEHFTKFLNDRSSMKMMLDDYILKYHVILAVSVVDISEIRTDEKKCNKWRDMTFRRNFFDTDDSILKMLRKELYNQILKTQGNNNNYSHVKQAASKDDTAQSSVPDESTVDKLISLFLSEPSALTLSTLIGTSIVYKKGNLHFTVERPKSDVQKLEQINISQSIVDEAEEIAARNILLSIKIKVPITFGNHDLAIGGSLEKVKKRLDILTDILTNLCKKTETVVIDAETAETIGDRFLKLNNGIGSAVGNLFVYDNVNKLLKFTNNPTSLLSNARALFDNLQNKLDNLDSYRFDMRSILTFPKLAFDYTYEAKLILNKIIIYEKQNNQNEIEETLKKEIEKHQKTHGPHNLPFKSDTVLLHYNNMIQKWWMTPRPGIYFTKHKNIYQEVMNTIIREPQITALQTTFCMNNLNYLAYNFSKTATESLALLEVNSKAVIITDISKLTTIKVIKCCRYNSHVVLDLQSVLNLPLREFSELIKELKNTKNFIVFVCESTKSSRILHNRLDELAQAMADKEIVVITNGNFLETIQEYFSCSQVLYDQNHTITDFSIETQRDIIKNTQVMFQGEEVSLNSLVDRTFIDTIKGTVLNTIFRNETISIGKSLSNINYERIKHLYVDRYICQASNMPGDNYCYNDVKTFDDITDNNVIIVADAGMGKSTLLTHLSLKTKEIDKDVWIVRINLLDHTKEFKKWQDDKTVINTLEAVKFMCQVVLNNNEVTICLKEVNSKVYLEACTGDKVNNNDEWDAFVLNIFLYCYNEKKIIFLFDGYDEICPHYINIVIDFIASVKNFPQEHKMWVTSRPYSEILPDLQAVYGNTYKLVHFDLVEQGIYLENIWKDKLSPEKISTERLEVIKALTNADSVTDYVDTDFYEEFKTLFKHLNNYVLSYIPNRFDSDAIGKDKLITDTFPSNTEAAERIIMGTPLLLYLLGNHIVNVIYNYNKNSNKCIRKTNLLTIYQVFVETQIDEIRFQVKNNMDTSRPDLDRIFHKERLDCINLHKKLAAHAVLDTVLYYFYEFKNMKPFSERKCPELDAMLDLIKSGREKTGLISHVTADNMPVFVHKTFAEYFGSEYLCDIFKSDKYESCNKRLLYGVLTNKAKVIFHWIEKKMEIDADLNRIIQDIKLNILGSSISKEIWDLIDRLPYFFDDTIINVHLNEKDVIRVYSSCVDDYTDDNVVVYFNEKSRELIEEIRPQLGGDLKELTHVRLAFYDLFLSKMKRPLLLHLMPWLKH